MMMDHRVVDKLTERQQRILQIVIQDYIQTAQPVSSRSIAEKQSLGVSSATIRNDLAALERLGLLTHPHTSAGRIPTAIGYRHFVRHLMPKAELPLAERHLIRHQFAQARLEVDQWLRLSASLLARASQNAALATPPRAFTSRFKHIELVAIQDTKVLLVLVLQGGTIKQQLLNLSEPKEQDELSRVSNELNEHFVGVDVEAMANHLIELTPFAQEVSLLVAEIMERIASTVENPIYRDGLAQILETPEFSQTENARNLVQIFEKQLLLEQVFDAYVERGNNPYADGQSMTGNVRVVISGEGRFSELQGVSLVIGRYGVANHATGVLGVVGPLRMSYGRTIGAVRFVAALMSDMVQDIYGV